MTPSRPFQGKKNAPLQRGRGLSYVASGQLLKPGVSFSPLPLKDNLIGTKTAFYTLPTRLAVASLFQILSGRLVRTERTRYLTGIYIFIERGYASCHLDPKGP
jgi:hypothetical protein